MYKFILIAAMVIIAGGKTNAGSSTLQSSGDTIYQLDRMVVTSGKVKQPELPSMQPAKTFTAEDIISTAGTAGDICRYIATLPSAVSSLGDNFDNTLYVRGGRPSEVVFVVDGIEMENINHFSKANGSGGPLGFINSEYVKKVDFFAGNAPVCYPSRLSSVVAIDLKPGSIVKYHSTLGCKLTGGMFSTEGPFPGGNSSFVVAGRYIDFSTLRYFVIDRIDDRGTPQLGDLYIKSIQFINDSDDVSVTGLLSNNKYKMHYPVVETDDATAHVHENVSEEQQKILQGGCGITYRAVRGALSNKAVFSCSFRDGGTADSLYEFSDPFFTARYNGNPYQEDSDARYRAGLTVMSDVAINSKCILNVGVRSHYQKYLMNTKSTRQYKGPYTYCSNGTAILGERTESPGKCKINFSAMESSGFGECTFTNAMLTSSLGLRADYYHLLHTVAFSPRLSVAATNENTGTFLAACGIQHQFPTDMPSMLFYTYSMFTDMEDNEARNAIINAMKGLKPLRCYQASLGYSHLLSPWLFIKSDAYFKWYDREYHFTAPDLQESFYFNGNGLVFYPQNGKRKVFGIEGTLESEAKSPLQYSVAASVFKVKNLYRDGNWYNDWTNVGYTLSLSLSMRFLQKNQLSISARGSGARPYCPEIISEDCIGRKSADYASETGYYTEKLDPIISVNTRYGYRQNIGRAGVELFIEVLNVLNAQPTLEYRFNGEELRAIKPFGIVPIAGAQIAW